jgi:hypothetical protein
MRQHRHHGRLSSEFLPPQTSLYNAMQAIIGAGLRERYSISQQLPPELDQLLKTLTGAHSGAEQPERAGNGQWAKPYRELKSATKKTRPI